MQNTMTDPRESFSDLWSLILLTGVTLLLVGVALWMFSSQVDLVPNAGPAQDPLAGISQTAFTAQTGIRLLRISFTAGGGMLDLRYQVVDPDKAVIVHDVDTPPTLVNNSTGQVIDRAYHDHSSKTPMRTGLTYNELVINEGRAIKPGDSVTLIIGEARLENILVQ
ncbi:MAG: hypothetical protein FOGNACKC_03131 [Anaerolineae bacterium]|nr:hypothetical protein [Anaerolineae bacterium]